MRFNRRGDLVAGVGSQQFVLWLADVANAFPVCPGAAIGWLTDDQALGFDASSHYDVIQIRRSQQWTKEGFASASGNDGFAGGGSWATTLAPNPRDAHPRYVTSGEWKGGELPAWVNDEQWTIKGWSRDGVGLFLRNGVYRILWQDGQLDDEWVPFVRPCDGDLLAAIGHDGIPQYRSRDGEWQPVASVTGGCFHPQVLVSLTGEIWIAYVQDDYGLVVHPASDATKGYQFGARPIAPYAPPDYLLDGNTLHWAYATAQSERPETLVRGTLTLGEGMKELEPLPRALPDLSRIPDFVGRAFGLICFTFGTALSLGNIESPVRRPPSGPGPIVAHVPEPGVRPWAYFAGDGSVPGETMLDAIRRVRPLAVSAGCGLVAYSDDPGSRIPADAAAEIGAGDIRSVNVYRQPGESGDGYRARLRAAYTRNPGCYPAIRIDTRGTLTEFEVVEGVVIAAEVAKEQAWPGAIWFRLGTVQDVPSVVPYLERWRSTCTVPPPTTAATTPTPPTPNPPPPEPVEPEMPPVNLTGAEYDAYLDSVRDILIRALPGKMQPADARAQAGNAVAYFHQACDRANKPRFTPTAQEVITLVDVYLGERDTEATKAVLGKYADYQVLLRR